jgi:NTP pyrophosphatase (non-canonical NTP hydrolase)
MISGKSSLRSFQALNRDLYLVTNDRNYGPREMFSRVHRHVTHVLKLVRKRRYEAIQYHLCMAMSWTMGLMNRFHVDISNEMWKRFPGICPYCTDAPCDCRRRRRQRHPLRGIGRGRKPVSLKAWQEMFAGIYRNRLRNSALHLAEEIGEVDEALQAFLATHDDSRFRKMIEELIDVVTNIIGVANCLKLDLSAVMVGHFSKGCPGCKQKPCACGFVAEA